MENKDLGSKKINNEQGLNEGFSGENIPEGYNPASGGTLKSETETDQEGNSHLVKRARHEDATNQGNIWESHDTKNSDGTMPHNQETVENKDRNFDIAKNRYPNSHPDNHIDRGNIKLDDQ